MLRKLSITAGTLLTVLVGFMMAVSPAQALTLHGSGYVFDDFSNLILQPDEDAYWYTLNWGEENGQPQIWSDQYCGQGSCVNIVTEGYSKFARLQVNDQATDGFYTNAELAERFTGFATTEPGKYLPTEGHPVVVNARVRWSSNFEADGSGTNIGSSGIWLWNSPVDAEAGYGYTESFGFVMGTANPFINGFSATQSGPSPFPNYSEPVRGYDVNDWMLLTMVWSQVDSTTQKVVYRVNGHKVGETTFDSFGALDLEIWHDTQTLNTDTFEIEFPTPAADQNFDLDFVSVLSL